MQGWLDYRDLSQVILAYCCLSHGSITWDLAKMTFLCVTLKCLTNANFRGYFFAYFCLKLMTFVSIKIINHWLVEGGRRRADGCVIFKDDDGNGFEGAFDVIFCDVCRDWGLKYRVVPRLAI